MQQSISLSGCPCGLPSLFGLRILLVQFVPLAHGFMCTLQAEDRRPVGLQPTVLSMMLLLSNTVVCHTGEKTSFSQHRSVDRVCSTVFSVCRRSTAVVGNCCGECERVCVVSESHWSRPVGRKPGPAHTRPPLRYESSYNSSRSGSQYMRCNRSEGGEATERNNQRNTSSDKRRSRDQIPSTEPIEQYRNGSSSSLVDCGIGGMCCRPSVKWSVCPTLQLPAACDQTHSMCSLGVRGTSSPERALSRCGVSLLLCMHGLLGSSSLVTWEPPTVTFVEECMGLKACRPSALVGLSDSPAAT